MCVGIGAVACLWRTESDFQDSVLTFHHMGSEDRTQGVKLGGKLLSPQTPTAVVFLFVCLLAAVCPLLWEYGFFVSRKRQGRTYPKSYG